MDTKKAPQRVLSFVWRWARDSNPGNLSVQRFSRPPLSTTQPAHQNSHDASLEKRRIIAGLFPDPSVGRLIFPRLIHHLPQAHRFSDLGDHLRPRCRARKVRSVGESLGSKHAANRCCTLILPTGRASTRGSLMARPSAVMPDISRSFSA